MRSNRHDSSCATCRTRVPAGTGLLIGRPGSWRVTCVGCRPTAPPPGDHAGWHLGPVASLDLETTGVDPLRDRVVSFALLDDQVERSGLVDPGVPIPEGASAVHGLDAAALRGAPAPRGALTEVLDWVQQVVDRGVPLVVFNAPYDLTMLRAEAERWGLVQPDWSRLLVIDPYVVDWGIVRGELGPRRLTDVAAYYEVELANAHDALADARAALEVARQIAARHVGVGTATVEDLVTDQRRWYAERADDWNRWARTAGRELDDPQGWPLITAATVRRSA